VRLDRKLIDAGTEARVADVTAVDVGPGLDRPARGRAFDDANEVVVGACLDLQRPRAPALDFDAERVVRETRVLAGLERRADLVNEVKFVTPDWT
jgi:hypothetical protein